MIVSDEFLIKPSRAFIDVTGDAVKIDWEEAERRKDESPYAKLVLAIRDGTWVPLRT